MAKKRKYQLVNSETKIDRLIVVISVLVGAIVFIPFAETIALALVFSLAILGAKDKLKSYSRRKQRVITLLLISFFFVLILISGVLIRFIGTSLSSASDPIVFLKFKQKIEVLLQPTIQALKILTIRITTFFEKSEVFEAKVSEIVGDLLESIVSFSWKWISGIPGNLLQFIFFLFFLVLLIRKRAIIKQFFSNYWANGNRSSLDFVILTAKESAYYAIVVLLITAFVQATVFTLGTLMSGIGAWILIFILAFFFAMIPVVGLFPLTLICAIYVSSKFGNERALVTIFFGIAASLIDNFLRSFLLAKGSSALNPILSFFGLFGSILILGFSGLFIGPFVLIFSSFIVNAFIKDRKMGEA